MRKAKIDPERVVLEPDGPDGLAWTFAPAPEPDKIAVSLKIDTAGLGQFLVPLTPQTFAVLVTVGQQLMRLSDDEVAKFRRELEEQADDE